jgi:hypothetical protein
LARTGHGEVKLLPDKRKISARSALLMAHSGDYEWGGTLHRIRWIKAMKPVQLWQPSYHNTEAPALQPSIEWVRSVSVIGGRS